MTSKEMVYEVIENCKKSKVVNCHNCILIVEDGCALDFWEEDLDRLEKLERENEELKEKIRLTHTEFGFDNLPEFRKQMRRNASTLSKIEILEKELGCSLEVILKALKDGIVIIDDEAYVNSAYDDNVFYSEYKENEYHFLNLQYDSFDKQFILEEINSPYGVSCCGYYGCSVKTNDYQKTWKLIEVRSKEE